jgi:hypothetical protein
VSIPKLALPLSLAGLLAGFAASFAITPRYVSSAALTFEYNPAGANPAASRPGLREWMSICQDENLSRTSLSLIMQDPRLDLYPEERARMPLEDVIEKMKRDIQIVPEGAGDNIGYLPFRITFTYREPRKTQAVVQTLITRFMESSLNRQRNSEATVRPGSAEIDQLETRVAMLEKRLGLVGSPPDLSDQETFVPAAVGIRLAVLDTPSRPEIAVSPNRLAISSAGLAAGFFAAVAIVVFRRRVPPVNLRV